ncbi:DUF4760 domain-containing protein [Actinokineospora inagensis]|uniref:DUF4760 domain-containing protein n=1 Tax=Actinokineospora inagensis TaxID=103730 RepID=UPI0004256EF1|nr:hypothetical protein [Actinokineospora inagensis]
MTGATVVSLLSPLIAVVLALWGFRRTSKADRLKAFFELQERYLAPEIRDGRRLVHELDGEPDPDTAAKISHMLAVLNSIAIAVEGGYVDGKLVAQSMARSYSSAVHAAKPYIDHLESVRGYRPFPFAERLAGELTRHVG